MKIVAENYGGTGAQERIAASLQALVTLTIAQMTSPNRAHPWNRQELIITLFRGGLRSRDIVAALGTTRQIVDPILSRYRKTLGQRSRGRDVMSTEGE